MRGKGLFILALIFFALAICNILGSQEAEDPDTLIAQEPEENVLLWDLEQFEAFVDGIMAIHMRDNHIAGATFSCVKDGEIFLAKGYGYANVERRKPVDPEKTMFRPGSVSKLITWTAVMQLVEQGKIDLMADENTCLENFKIPETFP